MTGLDTSSSRVVEAHLYAQVMPEHNRDGLERFIEQGVIPGDFLLAVLTNDLFGAFGKADPINMVGMPYLVTWLYNHAPHQCYGSPEAVSRWCQKRRAELSGLGTRGEAHA